MLSSVVSALLISCIPAPNHDPPVDFNRDIRPILSKNCYACHGPDPAHRAAGLRFDQRDAAVKILKSGGAAISPGKPEESLLIRRVTAGDETERMPPKEAGSRLTEAQIALLTKWIREGAPFSPHWAFVKPQRPPTPAVRDTNWPINAIDNFVLAHLERRQLKPSGEADRYALIRRLSLDLRGLPPTPDEADAFVNDSAGDAYEKLVDRFLADPAFGERWARPWLDLARYADSAGYGSDPLRPHVWRYREWVIGAFNRNLPFDQFTIEQLAGDLLPDPTLDQRIATAFHRNTMTNTEGGTDDEEFRTAAIKDRVDSTMQTWMGLTMGCAKCHTHKYDPITQNDYYRFYAVFNQTADNDQPDERPTIAAPTPVMAEQVRVLDGEIAALRQKLETPAPTLVATLVSHPSILPPPEALLILRDVKRLQKKRPVIPTIPVMQELPDDKKRETRLMRKGSFLDLGDAVTAGAPAGLHPLSNGTTPDRMGIAKWLTDAENPLTARVAVNRIWAQLWGTGLVETEEDFGTQGELPSHPELLDWLATEYVRLGWDTKAMLRVMVTSSTYRQASRTTAEIQARDPRNRWFMRGPRVRLEAEMVRDQALALSGLLSNRIGGPSVHPPQPPGLWQAAFNGERTWSTSTGPDRYRRGLYVFWRRTIPYPSMATFDAPSRETCSVRRIRSNTPLQAFVTLNDPCFVEAAQALARRLVREGGESAEHRARYGLRLCLGRPPEREQVRQIEMLYESERAHYRVHVDQARTLTGLPSSASSDEEAVVELAAWTVVANILLNLDGVLTKG